MATRPSTKESKKVLDLELLERDLERGKPLFRRKKGKVRNLDGSGHKGLADFQDQRLKKTHTASATDMFVEKCACRSSQGQFSLVLPELAKPAIESKKIRGGGKLNSPEQSKTI